MVGLLGIGSEGSFLSNLSRDIFKRVRTFVAGKVASGASCDFHDTTMLSILWRLRVAVMTLPLWVLLASPGRAANPRGVASIQSTQILEHTRVLASDEFEGRGPGTPGEA